jgi:hypothetical protein
MYITCKSLWDAGITKDQVSCCGSCHVDEDEFDIALTEIYPDEIGLPRSDNSIGAVCCAVNNFLDHTGKRRELLTQVYELQSQPASPTPSSK